LHLDDRGAVREAFRDRLEQVTVENVADFAVIASSPTSSVASRSTSTADGT
jgi:hypothetical protein